MLISVSGEFRNSLVERISEYIIIISRKNKNEQLSSASNIGLGRLPTMVWVFNGVSAGIRCQAPIGIAGKTEPRHQRDGLAFLTRGWGW